MTSATGLASLSSTPKVPRSARWKVSTTTPGPTSRLESSVEAGIYQHYDLAYELGPSGERRLGRR